MIILLTYLLTYVLRKYELRINIVYMYKHITDTASGNGLVLVFIHWYAHTSIHTDCCERHCVRLVGSSFFLIKLQTPQTD